MLRLRQEIRPLERAASLHLWEAASGAIRLAARCRNANIRKPENTAAHSLALRGSLAERSARLARRRHDGAGPHGTPRRVHGPEAPLRQGQGLNPTGSFKARGITVA